MLATSRWGNWRDWKGVLVPSPARMFGKHIPPRQHAFIEPRDPELLDARSVAQAEARVKAAEAALRQAEPNLESARAQADTG